MDNNLLQIRDTLRNNFKKIDLFHSIDSRYPIQSAHITIARFTKPIQQPKEYATIIKRNRTNNFGTIKFNEIEFSFNDWYHTNKTIVILDCLKL